MILFWVSYAFGNLVYESLVKVPFLVHMTSV